MTFTPPTLLSIVGIDLGDYSARQLTMTLNPIASGAGLRRSVNGTLLDLTALQFRKYQASVTATDVDAPALTNIWQGQTVTVTCIPNMGVIDSTDGTVTLSMMVDSWNVSTDEWGCQTSWTINLLEV